MYSRRTAARLWSTLLVCGVLLAAGCASNRHAWRPPRGVAPAAVGVGSAACGLELAEWHYARGAALQTAGESGCVDHFYHAATASWPDTSASRRAWELYHSAVTRLLVAAQQHRRWDPDQGILVASGDGLVAVPVTYHGFAWAPGDFDELAPVGGYSVPRMTRQFRVEGLGVPLVVVRHSPVEVPFLNRVQSFAATATLRPSTEQRAAPSCGAAASCFTLEFFNPLNSDRLVGAAGPELLARDLSAPFAYPPRGDDREWLQDFLRSAADPGDSGLFMLEPYQPGKIPVVFVHGLLSDPRTWLNMANELRACPELMDRYQIWAFRYSTGTQFFRSAADLRRALHDIQDVYDPCRTDAALARMVLVGHSMGGLLAKLQVVDSGDDLWQAVSNRPPSALIAPERVRQQVVGQLCFTPSPHVARVVFIGTPHQGSTDASRCIGRLGAALSQEPAERKLEHARLVSDNPGFFKPEYERRIPRSIDLLEPSNPLLRVTLRLPYSPTVRLHTIAGDIAQPFWSEPSDGVVSLASARLVGVCSEKIVDAKHTDLTHDPATIAEVRRVLLEHAR